MIYYIYDKSNSYVIQTVLVEDGTSYSVTNVIFKFKISNYYISR